MRCDWCLRDVEDVAPVQLALHTGIDGEPSDEELRKNPLPSSPRLIGQACSLCLNRGFYRQSPAFWLAEEHARAERAEAALQRRLG